MTTGWVLLALLAPPVAALAAGLLLRPHEPGPLAIIALNALVPGAGLAAAGRPTLETVLGVMLAQASLFIAGGPANLAFLVPIAVVGGVWGSLHTRLSPIELAAARPTRHPEVVARRAEVAQASSPASPARAAAATDDDVEAAGYSVAVRCTECGADVEVPVLARMAHCSFCGSDHLVVGHDDTLYVTIPEKVRGEHALREAVLDHYRYQHYLQLYRTTVAPLERRAVQPTTAGTPVVRPDADAAIVAAEAAISARADGYRRRLAGGLEIGHTQRFLAPYRHGMGTLYQAAFGRDTQGLEKKLQFATGIIEVAVLASGSVELPPMGKLSYLRALVPAAQCEAAAVALPVELGEDGLDRAYGNLDRKQLVRDLQVIRLGVAFHEDVRAVVWRPWWTAEVRGPRISETLLVDGAAGSVAGVAPFINPELFVELPPEARAPGTGLRFVSMQCPTCGHEFPFDPDAAVHFCVNCHRVCAIAGARRSHLPYLRQSAPDDGHDLVPFWCFPLKLRAGDGQLITDLMQLKDGIDGTFDQIGDDATIAQHGILVPAFRCINPRLMVLAFQRLFLHSVRRPPQLSSEPYPLDERPRPWAISLPEDEARELLPLYLASAFSRRDLARVNVHQVTSWLFEARQEALGRLAFVPVPKPLTEPFRAYIGRRRTEAIRHARTESPPQRA